MVALAGSAEADEQGWVARARQGDRQAFGELVRRHRQGVVNVVYRMCGDSALAEDAAQEAFLRAWQNLSRYQPRYAFRSWLYRIALNLAIDTLRRERPTADLSDEPLASSEDSPETLLERKQQAEQVRQAVLDLPPASRVVLVLREYEALSYQEIAEALDIPMGTVMSRLNYARGQMRRALSQHLEDR